MSNAIADFFGKYHAVRADDAGPKWSTTPESNLLDWYAQYRAICRNGWHRSEKRPSTPAEKAALMPILIEIESEILRRDTFSNKSADIFAAAIMIRGRRFEGNA